MSGTELKRLWAPWRLAYVSQARDARVKGCLFCRIRRAKSDRAGQVITRGKLSFTLLNRYPYNNGHLMVSPYRHVADLQALKPAEWLDMLKLAQDAIRRLGKVMSPHGYNLGINLGRVAGAGIPGHLHLHIVPRWSGDTNFMPTVAQTKVISQSLAAAYQLLKRANPKKA